MTLSIGAPTHQEFELEAFGCTPDRSQMELYHDSKKSPHPVHGLRPSAGKRLIISSAADYAAQLDSNKSSQFPPVLGHVLSRKKLPRDSKTP